MGTWWQGTRLVAERGFVENLRSRTFKVVTGLLLLLSAAAVALPQILGGDGTTYTLASVGDAPADVVVALDSAGKSAEFNVKYVSRHDQDAVRQAVIDGDATAGLAGETLYVSAEAGGDFPVLVAQAVVALETSRRLVEAGLSPQQIVALQSVSPPEQVTVGPVEDEERASVGFGVGIVLYLALTFAGTAIATSSRSRSPRASPRCCSPSYAPARCS